MNRAKKLVWHHLLNNIYIVGIPEGDERDQKQREIMTENFPDLMRHVNINIKETQQIARKVNSETHFQKWKTKSLEISKRKVTPLSAREPQ